MLKTLCTVLISLAITAVLPVGKMLLARRK